MPRRMNTAHSPLVRRVVVAAVATLALGMEACGSDSSLSVRDGALNGSALTVSDGFKVPLFKSAINTPAQPARIAESFVATVTDEPTDQRTIAPNPATTGIEVEPPCDTLAVNTMDQAIIPATVMNRYGWVKSDFDEPCTIGNSHASVELREGLYTGNTEPNNLSQPSSSPIDLGDCTIALAVNPEAILVPLEQERTYEEIPITSVCTMGNTAISASYAVEKAAPGGNISISWNPFK